ncbi:MAG TPA: type II secretion system F family protein, partial [Rhodocyclaceae bacterium]|nr:type II secretion system F family protein [Rhodocyclaceae bacterium]
MGTFAYRGRDSGGAVVEGTLESATAAGAADQLTGRGIIPLSITAAAARPAEAPKEASEGMFADKVGHTEVLLFSRQINTLMKAGVPIMRALTGLQESSDNKAMKKTLQEVRESLDSGRELSASLARHPKVFSPFYLSMVRVGEMTGLLEEIFLRLFHHLEFEAFMRNQVKSALRYPSFVVAAMIGAIIVVNIWVIPAFAQVFKGFNT